MLHNEYISYKTKQRDKMTIIKMLTYISFDKRDLTTPLSIKWDKGNCVYCETDCKNTDGKKGNEFNETFTLSKSVNHYVYFYCFLCQTWIEAIDKTGVIRLSEPYGRISGVMIIEKRSIEQMLIAVQDANKEFLETSKDLLLLNRKNV